MSLITNSFLPIDTTEIWMVWSEKRRIFPQQQFIVDFDGLLWSM